MSRTKVATYEILPHGYDHADYFPGCGTSFTEFAHCVTGAGSNAADAYADAVEQIASMHDVGALPRRPRGIRQRDKVPARIYGEPVSPDVYWYVSVRFNVSGDA